MLKARSLRRTFHMLYNFAQSGFPAETWPLIRKLLGNNGSQANCSHMLQEQLTKLQV